MTLGLTRGRLDKDAGSETRRCAQVSPGEAGNAQVLASLGWVATSHQLPVETQGTGGRGGFLEELGLK